MKNTKLDFLHVWDGGYHIWCTRCRKFVQCRSYSIDRNSLSSGLMCCMCGNLIVEYSPEALALLRDSRERDWNKILKLSKFNTPTIIEYIQCLKLE